MLYLKSQSTPSTPASVVLYWDGNKLYLKDSSDVIYDIFAGSSGSITNNTQTNDYTVTINDLLIDNYISNNGQTNNTIILTLPTPTNNTYLNVFNLVTDKIIKVLIPNKIGISRYAIIKKNEIITFFGTNNNWTYDKNINTELDIKKISCNGHGLILDNSGQVWGWGSNYTCQVGTLSFMKRYTPTPITFNVPYSRVFVGRGNSVHFLDDNDKLWGWGDNVMATVGNNSYSSVLSPVAVCGNQTFVDIKSSNYFTLGLDNTGKLWAWGSNDYGQLGDNTTTPKNTPVAVCGDLTFCQISIGTNFAVGLDNYGQAWAWGYGDRGKLGNNLIINVSTPVAVCGNLTFCQISCSDGFTIALDTTGKAWAWGYQTVSRGLGIGNASDKSTPVAVCGNLTFSKIFTGTDFTIATTTNNELWGWGYNTYGQLGNNKQTAYTPVQLCETNPYTYISTSSAGFVIAQDNNNVWWYWGSMTNGIIGYMTSITSLTTPTRIIAKQTFSKIFAGHGHVFGIDHLNRWWGWGDTSTAGSIYPFESPYLIKIPEKVWTDTTFCDISTGTTHSIAIDDTGQVWSWGRNTYCQLGNNLSTGSTSTPIAVCGNLTFCQISCGNQYTLGIDNNGKAWGWGYNSPGCIGNNTTTHPSVPVAVCGNLTFCRISCGNTHTLGIDNTGKLWAWGSNDCGQLGDNTISNKYTPVLVSTDAIFCQVVAGISHSIGLDNTGKIWAWGLNTSGQLGDGTFVSRRTPVLISGPLSFKKLAKTGYNAHSLAIDEHNRLWAWGQNDTFQLGDFTTINRSVPTLVCNKFTFCDVCIGTGFSLISAPDIYAWGQKPTMNINTQSPTNLFNMLGL